MGAAPMANPGFCIPWKLGPGRVEEQRFLQDCWRTAWHGTKMEAIYCSLYYGRLLESKSAVRGERFFRVHLACTYTVTPTATKLMFIAVLSLFPLLCRQMGSEGQQTGKGGGAAQHRPMGPTCLWCAPHCALGLRPHQMGNATRVRRGTKLES